MIYSVNNFIRHAEEEPSADHLEAYLAGTYSIIMMRTSHSLCSSPLFYCASTHSVCSSKIQRRSHQHQHHHVMHSFRVLVLLHHSPYDNHRYRNRFHIFIICTFRSHSREDYELLKRRTRSVTKCGWI